MKTIAPQIRRAAPAPPKVGRVSDPPSAAPAIHVEVEQIVFHGFTRAEGHRATAALQQELTRLVTTHGLPALSDSASPEPSSHLDAGTIRANAARPELTGQRAARALHEGLRA